MAWEVVNPAVRRGRFRVAVFDFDGTVSLVREGWARIMAGLGVDVLRGQNLPADPEAFLAGATQHPGSWWTDWAAWNASHAGEKVPARKPGEGKLAAIEEAPGSYVKAKAA